MSNNRLREEHPGAEGATSNAASAAFVALPFSQISPQEVQSLTMWQLLYQKAYEDARAAVLARRRRESYIASMN